MLPFKTLIFLKEKGSQTGVPEGIKEAEVQTATQKKQTYGSGAKEQMSRQLVNFNVFLGLYLIAPKCSV